jgi:hypothetical protein
VPFPSAIYIFLRRDRYDIGALRMSGTYTERAVIKRTITEFRAIAGAASALPFSRMAKVLRQ